MTLVEKPMVLLEKSIVLNMSVSLKVQSHHPQVFLDLLTLSHKDRFPFLMKLINICDIAELFVSWCKLA